MESIPPAKYCEAFQSTIPSQVSTLCNTGISLYLYISIHDTLAGIDADSAMRLYTIQYFNPRYPRRYRPQPGIQHQMHYAFQSTIPSQVSTIWRTKLLDIRFISIHDTLAGIDSYGNRTQNHREISIHDTLAGIDRCPG